MQYQLLLGVAAFGLSASAYVVSPGGSFSFGSMMPQIQSAAYLLENNPNGSNIIALPISTDGTLGTPLKTATGGKGSISHNATTGSDVAADPLGSQGPVTIYGNMLFTVNAGSNTVSMFSINPADPLHPTLVGSPADTQGDFPISVTYSSKLGKACVLNAGAKAGVTCYVVSPYTGLQVDGPLRQLATSIYNQTTPPQGPPNTAAQILFTPDSSAIIATIKGSGNKPNQLGSILAWPVTSGNVSTGSPVVSKINGLALPFGFSFLTNNTMLVSDAGNGGSIVSLKPNLTASSITNTVVANQVAACWSWYEPSLNAAYIIDAGVAQLYAINPQTGNLTDRVKYELPNNNTSPGLFDSSARNSYLYSLAATPGILVTNLVSGNGSQYCDLSLVSERQYLAGFAIWPSWS